jgi:hypothetical protein
VNDRDKLWRLLFEIQQQASRKRRGSDLKRYLVTDLEIIEEKARKALKLVQKGRTP